MTGSTVRQTFDAIPSSVRAARQFVCASNLVTGCDPDDVELVVSELVSNAVLHGGTSFVVALDRRDASLRVTVSDENPTLPEPRIVDGESVSGRGLQIVERLARRWGAQSSSAGKDVWFEMDCRVPVSGQVARQHPVPAGHWSVSDHDGQKTLAIVGPLDLVSAPPLREVLAVLASGDLEVLVDLSRCVFVDSVGISVLLGGVKRAELHPAAFRFRLSPAARRVFEVAGILDRVTLDGEA